MNSLWVVVIGFVVILTMYQLYAKRIDRTVIQADRERPTPARMYMDGVDFVPTSRYVLYGYHFKSIAAAGPIVGVITAAGLWGWLPSIIWLMVGVSLIAVTLGVVLVTVLAMGLGPLGAGLDQSPPDWSAGAISGSVKGINDGLNGGGALYTVEDPTGQDPRITRDPATGEPFESATFNPATGLINVLPSYIFWAIFLLVFSYLGANLPIWRFAQPVNYIGFWITALTIGLSAIGAILAPLGLVEGATDGGFQIATFNGFF